MRAAVMPAMNEFDGWETISGPAWPLPASARALELIPYRAHHVALLAACWPDNAALANFVRLIDDDARAKLEGPRSWTLVRRAGGSLLGCGGIQEAFAGSGSGTAWALVGAVPRWAWPAVTRLVRLVLDDAQDEGLVRIEASADGAHPAGMRWLARLGFALEGYSPKFAYGRDHWRYGRVR